jgi:hypothetical protein
VPEIMESGRLRQTRFRHEPFHSMTETVGVEGLPVAPLPVKIDPRVRRRFDQEPKRDRTTAKRRSTVKWRINDRRGSAPKEAEYEISTTKDCR